MPPQRCRLARPRCQNPRQSDIPLPSRCRLQRRQCAHRRRRYGYTMGAAQIHRIAWRELIAMLCEWADVDDPSRTGVCQAREGFSPTPGIQTNTYSPARMSRSPSNVTTVMSSQTVSLHPERCERHVDVVTNLRARLIAAIGHIPRQVSEVALHLSSVHAGQPRTDAQNHRATLSGCAAVARATPSAIIGGTSTCEGTSGL